MKFNCRQSDLARIVQNSLVFVQAKANFSIYANILLALNKNTLEIKSTNINSGFHGKIKVQGEENGVITIQAELFAQVVRNLKEEEMLSFYTDAEFLYISSLMSSVNYKIRFVCADSFDYKDMEKTDITSISITKNTFVDMANKAISCVSDDNTKPYLCGVLAEFDDKGITLVSTDSRCLMYYNKKNEIKDISEKKSIIIPGQFFKDFLKMDFDSDLIKIEFNNSTASISFSESTIWTVLTKATFPSTAKLLSGNYENEVVLKVDDVLKALRHVTVLRDDASKRICLKFSDNKLMISSLDKEELGFGKEDLDVDWSGEEVSFALCYTYLQNQLKLMPSSSFKIYFNQPKMPIKLVTEPVSDYYIIIMTMAVENFS